MSGKFKTAKKPPTGEAVVRALTLDYLAVQAEFKALETRKREIGAALMEALEEMGEEKMRIEDVGSVSITSSPRTTYSRQSVAEALVTAKVPEKYHVALLDAAGRVTETRYVTVRGLKDKDNN